MLNTTSAPGLRERIRRLVEADDAALPRARREALVLVMADPQRALDEGFARLAQRSGCSLPTLMRSARDLGFAGLREFRLALARDLARRLGGDLELVVPPQAIDPALPDQGNAFRLTLPAPVP